MRTSGLVSLFDGVTTRNWATAGSGRFVAVNGRLESSPGSGVGLFWYMLPMPPDFVLHLRWLRWRDEDASGVVVRFPRPTSETDANPFTTAAHRGIGILIDEVVAPLDPGIHSSAAIVDEPDRALPSHPPRPPAEWNELEITVEGQRYGVSLNGRAVTTFVNRDAARGLPSRPWAPTFVGLQLVPGARVAFRDIRMRPL